MSKIIPDERNKYARWYDKRPDFQLLKSGSRCKKGDWLLQNGKLEEAIECYVAGAAEGDSEAMCSLGLCYQFFDLDKYCGVDKAMHYYYGAVRKGHPLAKCLLYRLTQENVLLANAYHAKDSHTWKDHMIDWKAFIDYDALEKEVHQEGFGDGKLAQRNYFWYKTGTPIYKADVRWECAVDEDDDVPEGEE